MDEGRFPSDERCKSIKITTPAIASSKTPSATNSRSIGPLPPPLESLVDVLLLDVTVVAVAVTVGSVVAVVAAVAVTVGVTVAVDVAVAVGVAPLIARC